MLNYMAEWFTKIKINVGGGAAKRMCLEKKGDFLGYSISCWHLLVSFTDTCLQVTKQLSHALVANYNKIQVDS